MTPSQVNCKTLKFRNDDTFFCRLLFQNVPKMKFKEDFTKLKGLLWVYPSQRQECLQSLILGSQCSVAFAGHFLLPALVAGLCFPEAERLLTDTSNLFQHHLQDCSVTIMTAYTAGNFTKVDRFVILIIMRFTSVPAIMIIPPE